MNLSESFKNEFKTTALNCLHLFDQTIFHFNKSLAVATVQNTESMTSVVFMTSKNKRFSICPLQLYYLKCGVLNQNLQLHVWIFFFLKLRKHIIKQLSEQIKKTNPND